LVGVFVGVLVGVFVGVFVGVLVGVFVGVFVGVLVGVCVGVAVGPPSTARATDRVVADLAQEAEPPDEAAATAAGLAAVGVSRVPAKEDRTIAPTTAMTSTATATLLPTARSYCHGGPMASQAGGAELRG
jgi:hypothetical protein